MIYFKYPFHWHVQQYAKAKRGPDIVHDYCFFACNTQDTCYDVWPTVPSYIVMVNSG